jgi:hypothetical protein
MKQSLMAQLEGQTNEIHGCFQFQKASVVLIRTEIWIGYISGISKQRQMSKVVNHHATHG